MASSNGFVSKITSVLPCRRNRRSHPITIRKFTPHRPNLYTEGFIIHNLHETTDSVLQVGRPGVRIPVDATYLISSKTPYRLCGQPSLLVNVYRCSFGRYSGRGVRLFNHPLLPSAEIKTEWSYTSAPPYIPSWRRQGKTLLLRFIFTVIK
jgi:hypothetical protein